MTGKELFEQIDQMINLYQGYKEPLILILGRSLYKTLTTIENERISKNEGDYYIDGKIKVVKG